MKKMRFSELMNIFGMPVSLMVLGLILLVCPDSASVLIAYLVGGVLLLAGIVTGIGALLDRRISGGIWALLMLSIGGTLLGNPLLLARNVGRFLGILLAIEGGDCLRKGSSLSGGILLAAAVTLVFAPMALSRFVFSLCGLAVLVIGIVMLINRLRQQKYLPGGDDNIIDAL